MNLSTQEVPGIAFLSGGQSEIEATENLNIINKKIILSLLLLILMELLTTKCFETLVKKC